MSAHGLPFQSWAAIGFVRAAAGPPAPTGRRAPARFVGTVHDSSGAVLPGVRSPFETRGRTAGRDVVTTERRLQCALAAAQAVRSSRPSSQGSSRTSFGNVQVQVNQTVRMDSALASRP